MIKLHGIIDKTAKYVEKEQLMDPVLWAKFVEIFRVQPDSADNAWRGEYWGKMMRAGVLVYQYTRSEELYSVLTESVLDMLSTAEDDGRVSSYKREKEFCGWDMWCRKYVILACEYYLEISRDEKLNGRIIEFIKGVLDYVIAHVGEGKIPVNATSGFWRGLNSSSILEPVVRLYNITKEKRYLDFAAEIVRSGGADGVNIFKLAYENKILPYQYGVSKAYEMMSCFEGLYEYYKVTGEEKYKTAVINFARAIIESDVSIIGSCGVTHELLDHTRVRQTVNYDGVMQETCVSVTWMKFCSRLLELTGDSIFADEMERSFYNAYLGALNIHHNDCVNIKARFKNDPELKDSFMLFDSYAPLTPGKRGQQVGGSQLLLDKSYYGCCACIGGAGVGVMAASAVTTDGDGVTLNFFENMDAELVLGERTVSVKVITDYPRGTDIRVGLSSSDKKSVTLRVRNPGWSSMPSGYSVYEVESGETVEIKLDMPLVIHRPEHWDTDVIYTNTDASPKGTYSGYPMAVEHKDSEDDYVAFTRGPLTLGADERFGKPLRSVFTPSYRWSFAEDSSVGDDECILKIKVECSDGEVYYLANYSSIGLDWKSDIAAWLPTK